jgi:hypothetical protein
VELHVCLGYPLRELVGIVRKMGNSNTLWAELLLGVQDLRRKLERE